LGKVSACPVAVDGTDEWLEIKREWAMFGFGVFRVYEVEGVVSIAREV
jgi:hypothetical protein